MEGRHRTRNRVPQYPHVAIPKRSMFPGGAPQFGHGISIGPRGGWGAPAGGLRAVGGGGTDDRFPESPAAITPPPATMRANPRPAITTGWTNHVTAATRVPNMNTMNPAKIRPIPATI